MEKERVRIADIAQELGLSTATVSNVLHGKTGRVSAETARRVQALLEQRDYIPSMAGILLARNDSKILGVVVNDHEKYEGHVLEDGFISASLNALSRELDEAGYFMMVKVTGSWQDIDRYASMWNMVGLVLIGFCQQEYQALRDRMRIPFVIYDGFWEGGSGLVNLVIDHFGGGRTMGQHLQCLGHRRVLCISDNDTFMDRQRYLGLRSVLPEAALLVVPMKKEDRDEFYREKLPWIRKFSAIFAVSDYYAADILHFLQQQGIRVPEEMSVAGFDDSMLSRQVCPSITTIGQDHRERARLALSLLLKLRAHETIEPVHLMEGKLLIRESTGYIAQKSGV